jgi:malonyl-CoA/methylmalonyl-CoA synthetase
MNLYRILEGNFPRQGGEWALEVPEVGRYSWADLQQGSAMMAHVLSDSSQGSGSRVVCQVEKSPEALMLYLACLRAGLVYVPLNTAYRDAEVEYFLRDTEPEVVIVSPERFGRLSPLAFSAGAHHVYTLSDKRTGSLLERALHQPRNFKTVHRAANDLAALLYTSGTTGRSKGAMLSHHNLISNAQTLCQAWKFSSNDVLLHALPLFHIHGLFVACHTALLSGARMIFLPGFDVDAVVQRLPQATVFMGVPTYYTRLLTHPDMNTQSCASVRLFVSGSAPLLAETFTAFEQRTGQRILERYGMSETGMLTSNPYQPAEQRIPGTVGQALPGVEVRVSQQACSPESSIGAIEVRGPNVFSGYWRQAEKTQEAFTPDGWFQTGDLGRWTDKAYLSTVGRSKDLIISGGYNVYPKEIEDELNALAYIEESAVIGVPHPDFGEAVVAIVVARPGFSEREALTSLRQRLANYKCPKHIMTATALPRNAMGKLQKNALREQYGKIFANV